MGERDKMINGEIYEPFCQELEQDRFRAKELCREYNLLHSDEKDKKQKILKKLLGNAGDGSIIEPNFFCDYGYNIEFDGFVYVNHNSVFLDCAKDFGKVQSCRYISSQFPEIFLMSSLSIVLPLATSTLPSASTIS